MKRDYCEICSNKNLEVFYTIHNLPVQIGVSEKAEGYKFLDLKYAECQRCKNVQILNLPNIGDVYAANHNINVIGKTWKEHNEKFAAFVLDSLPHNAAILEIGDPSAKIASLLVNTNNIKQWDIVEPNPEAINVPNVTFILAFFDTNFNTNTKYDALVMSHLFEHLIDIRDLLPVMFNVLNENGVIVMTVPNLQHILNERSMAPAGIHFEHTFYFNKDIIIGLFNEYGFELTGYEAFKNHSEFFCFAKTKSRKKHSFINKDYAKQKILATFKAKNLKIKEFNESLKKTPFDGVFIYGAHIQTQMYVCIGLEENKLSGVLDNDTSKQNKYVYGTNLKVTSPQSLADFKNPVVFCDMGPYTQEITQQMLKINPNTVIV